MLVVSLLSDANADTLNLSTLYNPPLAYEKNEIVTGALVEIVTEAVKELDEMWW